MLIKDYSKNYLKKIREKAKMYEYKVPANLPVIVENKASELVILCIAIVGDISEEILNMKKSPIILSDDEKEELYFASKFFDSYFQSKINIKMNPYYILMGAVTYYFCDMIGSSKVMISIIPMPDISNFEFHASGLENIIMWLLDNNYKFDINEIDEKFKSYIKELVNYYNSFFECKNIEEFEYDNLRRYTYTYGNDREILFMDIILAILKKKTYNSCINLMPLYSNITKEKWIKTFENNEKMKEMWASQILLGEKEIFKGKSGVIQMPTNSGKTTSVALAIQSAFLSNRTNIVVVVAPFRALCKEIIFDLENFFEFDKSISVTGFSDIPEYSEIEATMSITIGKKILVMTPEKLAYIIRYNNEIIEKINMIVFDEAHLFDDEVRGTDYELLMTTINRYIKPDTQKLLVSAVISNATQLNEWINNNGIVISNNTIKTSEKTVAFNKLISDNYNNNYYSNLYFVDINKNLEEEFFVPRVVEKREINRIKNEKKSRFFPDSKEKQDLGIYYAIKLIMNGSIAIFCSKKNTVNTIINRFIDLKARGVVIDDFCRVSDKNECLKIAHLIEENIGESNLSIAASNGILGHHSGVPNGIRTSGAYALKKGLIKCVVCTSTLAQGVNLPIKYLIVSNLYQSKQLIRVRDFHNLIGRTARAGKETEGTIILTENIKENPYQSENYKKIFNANNSEQCSSTLLRLVEKIELDKEDFLKKYINLRYTNKTEYEKIKKYIIKNIEEEKYHKEILGKISEIENILISLENYILEFIDFEDKNSEIIQSTYGYYLANKEEKQELEQIYNLIKSNIDKIQPVDKPIYRKSMLGILKTRDLLEFIEKNFDEIINSDFDKLLNIILIKLKETKDCKIISKCIDNENIYDLLQMWINGESYIKIWNYSKSVNLQIKKGKKTNDISLEDIITLCDSDFGYVSLSIIQAMIEVLDIKDSNNNIKENLDNIINRIRYGLPNKKSVYIYELGFDDRIISQKIAEIINDSDCKTKSEIRNLMIQNNDKIGKVLEDYPSYFLERFSKLK